MAVPSRSGASPTNAVKEMAEAISHEIMATRRSGARWRRIGPGKRLASGPTGALYEFAPGGGRSSRRGRSVELQVGEEIISASVPRVADDALWLRLPQDLGPEVGPARMRDDAAWMLIEQRKQLIGLGGRLPRLAESLLCPAETRTGLASAEKPPDSLMAGLNGEQAAAVTRALDSELSYVWGPPGTGKTLTLARIAEACFREGRSVLIAAPTNRAVDHLLSAVLERLKGEKEVAEHAVVRLGPIVSAALDRRWGDLVDLDRAAGMAFAAPRTAADTEAMTDVLARLDREDADAGETVVVERVRKILAGDLSLLKARRAARWPALEAERERLLQRARLVATTLHRASLPEQLRRDFDVLIVDEANAAQFPTVFLAAAGTRERVVIAGDFRQLPPVVLS
ncbi:MAG TPA: AAA domain-containing protein, partial [Gammaproteobacteria bacterium]|nr:AAA domain-containing protein [Gammaproteobacteria bacterium]